MIRVRQGWGICLSKCKDAEALLVTGRPGAGPYWISMSLFHVDKKCDASLWDLFKFCEQIERRRKLEEVFDDFIGLICNRASQSPRERALRYVLGGILGGILENGAVETRRFYGTLRNRSETTAGVSFNHRSEPSTHEKRMLLRSLVTRPPLLRLMSTVVTQTRNIPHIQLPSILSNFRWHFSRRCAL